MSRPKIDPEIKKEITRFGGRRVVIKNRDGNERGIHGYYHEGLLELTYKAALLGAAVPDLARFHNVTEDTIWFWMRKKPGFREAWEAGKDLADANVAKRFYNRACGYSHPDVKIFYDQQRGDIVQVPFTRYYPPDTGAAIAWLKARQPDRWNPKEKLEVMGVNGQPLQGNPVIIITPVQPMPVDDSRTIDAE